MRLLVIIEVSDTLLEQMRISRSNDCKFAPHRINVEWGATRRDGWVDPIGYISNHRFPEEFRLVETIHDLPEMVADRVVMRMGDELAKVFRRFGLRDTLLHQQFPL